MVLMQHSCTNTSDECAERRLAGVVAVVLLSLLKGCQTKESMAD